MKEKIKEIIVQHIGASTDFLLNQSAEAIESLCDERCKEFAKYIQSLNGLDYNRYTWTEHLQNFKQQKK